MPLKKILYVDFYKLLKLNSSFSGFRLGSLSAAKMMKLKCNEGSVKSSWAIYIPLATWNSCKPVCVTEMNLSFNCTLYAWLKYF